MRVTRWPALLGLFCTAFGCGTQPPARAPEPISAAPATEERLPKLSPGAPEGDALWRAAATGEPIDRRRLAEREGAAGLLAAVERGGTQGLVALAALPEAGDGEIALGRLCELAERLKDEGRRPLLNALNALIVRMEPDRERLAGHALSACAAALDRMLKRPDLAPHERDLASASRAALADYVEPSAAP